MRREHPQIDCRARVEQRREAANGVAAVGALDDARQLVDVVGPGSQPGAFQFACDRVGDGLPGRRGELLLQRVEVLSAGYLGAIRRFDGERHTQMRRQLVEVEGVDRHEHAGASPQLSLQALQQRFSCRL